MAILLPQDSLVLNAYAALVGQTPGNAAYTAHKAYIATNGEAAYKAALNTVFANSTTAQLATSLLTNLGLSSIFTQAQAEAYLAANASNRVGAMMDLAAQLYSYNGSDASLVAAKAAYVNAVDGSYNYSINTANVSGATLSGTIISGGQTFTLTDSIDTLNGTAGNDTFIGDNNTASAADQLTGGTGTDTLKLYDTVTLPTFSGIESLYLNSAGASLDVSSKSEITSFTVDNEVTADGVAFTIAAGQAVTLSSITEGTAGHDLNIASAAAVTSVSLTADKVGTSTTDVDVDIAGNGVTTLNLTSANNASYFSLVNSGGALATINVSGDKAIAINLDVDSNAGDIDGIVTKVDAAAMTAGGVTVTLEDDTAPKNVTFIGGKGDDQVNFGVEFTVDDSATGGDGTDTIGIGDGADLTLASGAKATGFEKLSVAGGTGSYDLDFLSGITGVIASGGAAAVTIVDLAAGADVTVKAALAGGTLTVNQKDAGAGSPDDSLTVTINAAAGFSTTQDIDVNDIETVTLKTTSTGASQTHTITNLIADEATSVKVEASTAAATFTDLNAAAMVLFDASSSTKAVSLTTTDTFTSTSGVAFKGGAGSDTFTLQDVGDFSSTADTATVIITGGAGGDAIELAGDGGTANAGHTDGEEYTFKFADGDSISVAGAGNGFDTTKTDEISGIDSTTAFVAATDAAGSKFTLDTNQTASDKTFSTTAVTFGTTTVANAYDFYIFDNNANTANTAYVYQDTDGDKVIEAGEFAVMLTGTAQFVTGDFTVTSGNLVFATS